MKTKFQASGNENVSFLQPLEPRLLLSAPPLMTDPDMDVLAGGTQVNAGGQTAKPTPSPSKDDYGNTFADAYTLTLSSSGSTQISGMINTSTDLDYFKFTATVTGKITVKMTPPSGRKAVNPDLTVYRYDQVQLGHAAASSAKSVSVSFDAQAGALYYIRAASVNRTTGPYVIDVSTTYVPGVNPPSFLPGAGDYPTPAGTVTAQAVNTSGGTVLVVQGTVGADTITISQRLAGLTLNTPSGSQSISGSFAGVVIYGYAGSDWLRLDSSLTVVSATYAGDGNDSVFENGPGVGYEYGQADDDLLVAVGGGVDVVRGGPGLDSFWIDSSDLAPDIEQAEIDAGNVHRISSFNMSMPLEIQGQKLADPSTSYDYEDYSAYPVFAPTKPVPLYNDVRQGYLGDCYYLASLGSLAFSDPGIIRQMIAPMGDNTYALRFYSSGQEVYVRIDSDLPVSGGSLIFAKLTPGNELWVALAEKAYAQWAGGNSYAKIGQGGYMDVAYRQVTGKSTSTQTVSGLSWQDPAQQAYLANYLGNHIQAGHALTAGSLSANNWPIVGGHAYEVIACQNIGGTWYVTVYNPWGVDGVSPDYDNTPGDGVLTLSIVDFMKRFSWIAVSLA